MDLLYCIIARVEIFLTIVYVHVHVCVLKCLHNFSLSLCFELCSSDQLELCTCSSYSLAIVCIVLLIL